MQSERRSTITGTLWMSNIKMLNMKSCRWLHRFTFGFINENLIGKKRTRKKCCEFSKVQRSETICSSSFRMDQHWEATKKLYREIVQLNTPHNGRIFWLASSKNYCSGTTKKKKTINLNKLKRKPFKVRANSLPNKRRKEKRTSVESRARSTERK